MTTLRSYVNNQKTGTAAKGSPAALVFSLLFFAVGIVGCGNLPQGRYGQEAVKIAVLPAYSTAAMSARFLPLLDRLSRETGFDVQYISAENVGSFGAAIENSQAQLVICDALTLLTLQKTKNAVILAVGRDSAGSTATSGLIVTTAREYSRGINDVSRLQGKAVCCGSRQSAEGYLSQAKYLFDRGLAPERDLRVVTVGQLDRVLGKLSQGGFAAGFIPQALWNDSLAQGYRILAAGQPVPNWALVSLQGGHTEMDEKIRDAVLSLDPARSEDRNILSGLGVHGFSDVKNLDFTAFSVLIGQMKVPY